MNAYKHHFANHFKSCRLLGKGHDPHRNREVEFRAIPGNFDLVGITDGVDAWICPASSPFILKIKQALEQIRGGGNPDVVFLTQEGSAPTKKRKHVEEEQEPPPRPRQRRSVIEEDEEVRPRPRRTHVHS